MGGLLGTHQEKTGKDDDLKSMNHQHTYANFTMLLKKPHQKKYLQNQMIAEIKSMFLQSHARH